MKAFKRDPLRRRHPSRAQIGAKSELLACHWLLKRRGGQVIAGGYLLERDRDSAVEPDGPSLEVLEPSAGAVDVALLLGVTTFQ